MGFCYFSVFVAFSSICLIEPITDGQGTITLSIDFITK